MMASGEDVLMPLAECVNAVPCDYTVNKHVIRDPKVKVISDRIQEYEAILGFNHPPTSVVSTNSLNNTTGITSNFIKHVKQLVQFKRYVDMTIPQRQQYWTTLQQCHIYANLQRKQQERYNQISYIQNSTRLSQQDNYETYVTQTNKKKIEQELEQEEINRQKHLIMRNSNENINYEDKWMEAKKIKISKINMSINIVSPSTGTSGDSNKSITGINNYKVGTNRSSDSGISSLSSLDLSYADHIIKQSVDMFHFHALCITRTSYACWRSSHAKTHRLEHRPKLKPRQTELHTVYPARYSDGDYAAALDHVIYWLR